jgi:hypothetical protein
MEGKPLEGGEGPVNSFQGVSRGVATQRFLADGGAAMGVSDRESSPPLARISPVGLVALILEVFPLP